LSEPLVVFVSGPPASGKTSIAADLARGLGIPMLAKDQIKEQLAATLEVSDHDGSKALGAATWDLLFLLAERLLEGNTSFVFESNFYPVGPHDHRARLQALRERFAFVPFEVHCTASPEVLYRREHERPRHRIHTQKGASPEEMALATERNAAVALSSDVVELDTTHDEPVPLDEIIAKIREAKRDTDD